jgi:hypothetical protein
MSSTSPTGLEYEGARYETDSAHRACLYLYSGDVSHRIVIVQQIVYLDAWSHTLSFKLETIFSTRKCSRGAGLQRVAGRYP